LWNILLGEMILVGPRPNVPWEVEAYDSWHNERLEVKPGITGLAQVKGRSGIPFDQLVKYDVEYVRQQSVLMDWKIIWWTVLVVLQGDGSQ
jgi:lipopolysaccharide/colanic/teichoic acid biosynthesis glycosyltransferase